MDYAKYLTFLQDQIGAAVFSTIDEDNRPQARFINVGVGNEQGIFFMTSKKTDFYHQLDKSPFVSITGMSKDDKGIEVIRLQGEVRKVGKEYLTEILKDNPYVKDVYPDKDEQKAVQAFQVFKGKGQYQHLQQRIVESFEYVID